MEKSEFKTIALDQPDRSIPFAKLLVAAGLVSSIMDGLSKMTAGAVTIDGEALVDLTTQVVRNSVVEIRVGKRRQAWVEII